MCGICGIWKYGEPVSVDEKELINRMNQRQKHRGPDDGGIFSDGKVVLGHRRLSIIDLSNAGHQPFCYNEKFWLIYNGEIYNYLELRTELQKEGYLFKTKTDTEVVCAAYDCWGAKCFERFNGFWALAIYDAQKQTLCLSRDRYGVKPLYYYSDGNRFLFASEIKAIVCDSRIPRKVNKRVISDYLVYGLTDHTNETFFQGIYAFPPASYAIISQNVSLDFVKYYNLNINYQLKSEKDAKGDIKEFRKLFHKSIKLRLRADVEVAALLSGGLDSSAIVCAANKMYEKSLKTYSASFQGFRLDETEYIDAVLDYTKITGKKLTPTANDFWSDIDQLIYLQDQPFGAASAYASYYLMRQIKKDGIKVILDGQGSDEILCGYRKSRVYFIKKLLQSKRYLSALREALCSINQFATSDNIHMDLLKIYGILLKKGEEDNNFIQSKYRKARYNYSAEEFILNDITKISLPSILRGTDRISMNFSIEDRLPFLDYHLVDFSIALPLQDKIKNGWSKYIMRKALDLPKKVKYRKTKIGFVSPEEEWLKDLDKEIILIFENDDFRSGEFVDREAILNNWETIISNPAKMCLFRFICLEKWMQIYDVQ